jgi:hypothetical protein
MYAGAIAAKWRFHQEIATFLELKRAAPVGEMP